MVPITRQCAWLGVPRSSVYYQGKPAVSDDDLALMRRLDAIHLQHPFLGSRRLRDRLERDGVLANRKRIQRLMRVMGIETLYPKRKTSAPGAGHRIYPYLLRGLVITRPNQVWCADVTYSTPSQRGPPILGGVELLEHAGNTCSVLGQSREQGLFLLREGVSRSGGDLPTLAG